MRDDNQPHSQFDPADDLPEQSGPSHRDYVDAECRLFIRDILEEIGLTPAIATKLGMDLSPLTPIDQDD